MTNRIRMRRRHKRHKARNKDRNESNRFFWELQSMTYAWTQLASMMSEIKKSLCVPDELLVNKEENTATQEIISILKCQPCSE